MKKEFLIKGRRFELTCEEDVRAQLSLLDSHEGITTYRISFEWESLVSPKQVTISYRLPCVDAYYVWDPLNKRRDIPFGKKQITESFLADGMPLKGIVSRDSRNKHLVALSDVKTPTALRMATRVFSREDIEVAVDLFTSLTGPFKTYETELRIDERDMPLSDALEGAREWFDSLGYKNTYVPSAAKSPMYSTWYSYGQDVSADDVIAECRVASEMGMTAVILDDGWQTDNSTVVYGYCGDWKPVLRKFPDMRELSDKLHAMGMKLLVWYSVPFIGHFSENYKQFEGKYLRNIDTANCSSLDPRYKSVRDFLINTYVSAVKEWNLDGLKLDFIDRFKTNGEYSPEMDFVSVEDAVERLLQDISRELKAVNPDILIEFRQPYYGPVVSTYGNMMRVWDCPLDGCMNKNQSINLRLVSGKCAVHSDMICWNGEERIESVALQLYGTMFSVPQISVRFSRITEDQKGVLGAYLDFWNENRDLLMEGRLSVKLDENGYGYAETVLDGRCAALLSSSNVFEFSEKLDSAEVVDMSCSGSVILKNSCERELVCEVIDLFGNTVETVNVRASLSEIKLPPCGRLSIRKA